VDTIFTPKELAFLATPVIVLSTPLNREHQIVILGGRERGGHMIRMCYGEHHEGDRKIGEKPPFENNEETHGLCDACFEHEKIEIQLALKRLREAGWKPGMMMETPE
jgi:hypothetical protein